MREVFPLEQHAHAEPVGQAWAIGHRGWAPRVTREQRCVFGPEGIVVPRGPELTLELFERGHQRFGRVPAAVLAETAETLGFGARRFEQDAVAACGCGHGNGSVATSPARTLSVIRRVANPTVS